ncbi:MAG: Mu-like prophage major head subunit gpT family protein [Vicinamibacterales bacterium]
MPNTIFRRFRENEGDLPAGEAVEAPTGGAFTSGASWLLEASDLSLDSRMDAVRRAVREKYAKSTPGCDYDGPWVEVTFDDYVIVRKGDDRWRLDYSIGKDDKATLGEPTPVRLRYEAAKEATDGDGAGVDVTASCVLGPLTEDGQIFEASAGGKPSGKLWGVVIIREGMSANRRNYRRKALQEAAALYEGARMYTDHQETPRRFGRSVHECVGFLKDVRPALVHPAGATEAKGAGTLCLVGTAVVTRAAWRQELLDAYENGKPDLFGLSHDVLAESVAVMNPAGPYHDVVRIKKVDSVDWVTNPAAGGRLMQLVASNTLDPALQEDARMLNRLIEAIKASGNAGLIAKLAALGESPTENGVLAIYDELRSQEATARAAEAAGGGESADRQAPPVPAAAAAATTTQQFGEAELRGMRRKFGELLIDSNLQTCSLPDVLKKRLRGRMIQVVESQGAITEDAVVGMIRDEVETYGQLAESGIVLPAGGQRIELGAGPSEKFAEALDNFFDTTKPATGFRQIYVQFTGDERVTGRLSEAKRLTESVSSGTFDQAFGDSVTRRMVKDYQASPLQNWRNVIAEVVPLTDFRTQRRIRYGGYPNLSIVSERAPYPALTTPTDEEATYAPAKRGGTESVSLEAIKNDDVSLIRRIPSKMAKAAAQTLHEFVWDFLAANPTIYDSTALIASGHVNLVSTALSDANIESLRQKIKQQTDMSNGKRLGLVAKYLIVPNDLESAAFKLLKTEQVTGSNNNDRSFVASLGLMPIVIDYWTDTNNYFITTDPTQTPMIEIGFLDGQEDPELLLQDMPNVGSMFANDTLTWRVRHIYGGAVTDYRGFSGGIVA